MSVFTDTELAFLRGDGRRPPLARVATVGADGTPHVTPVGMWTLTDGDQVIQVTGHDFATTKKFRDVARTGRAAIVVDDFGTNPDPTVWQPRGLEVRGHAETVTEPRPAIRIYPERIVAWGLDQPQGRTARTVTVPGARTRP
jgi:pyridoxamine 5'-phosphate oxidase family protein